ncbi:type I secretion C-terminal target domain-containing protein [Desulfovibrio cuneatus]|uniref:type I secretion C-terminal target domain-containing protein n=1 Tax=Desulfovibrio cuneatus TaxID=159728 RepID=UPI0003F8EA00|nr:type I secretion C-terminal target domain-containing protein [Desulfovibrio cuneatus]
MVQQSSSQKTGATPMAITAPAAGEMLVVPSAGNETLHFEFDTATSSFVRSENDLVVTVEGGGKVTLENFFAVGAEGTLPTLVLADGTVVAGADFLRAQSPDMDITTAAGPAQASPTSGLSAYDDAAGSLMGGTDRLGSLGTDQWGGTTGSQQEANTGLITPAAAEAAPAPTPTPAPTPGPVPPVDNRIEYNTRGVLYTKGGGERLEMSLLDGNGNAISPAGQALGLEWKLPAGAGQYFNDPVVEGDKLVFTLTQAGKDALAAGENIYNYLTITTGQGNYTLQLIADPKDIFDSGPEDTNTANGGKLAEGGLIHGEWHEGAGFEADVNRIDSSGLGDTVTFTQGISASGAGKTNTIGTHTIAGKEGSVSIDSGAAAAAMSAVNAGTNLIDGSQPSQGTASGKTTVELASTSGMGAQATSGGSNTIQDVTSITVQTADNAMHAESGGKNIFQRVTDAVKLFVTGGSGMNADGAGSENTISDAGSVEINASGAGMEATNGAANTITSRGDVSVEVAGASTAGLYANAGSSNTITAQGTVDIHSTASSATAYGSYAAGGTNEIRGTEGASVSATSTTNAAYGLAATSGGKNILASEDETSITATSNTGIAYATYAYGATNQVTGDNVAITASSGSGTALGMYAAGSGKNSVQSTGDVTILANMQDTGAGGYTVTGAGSGYGIYSDKGVNEVLADGVVTIAVGSTKAGVSGATPANGVCVANSGTANVTAQDIHIITDAMSGGSYGAASYGAGSTINLKAAGTVSINSTTQQSSFVGTDNLVSIGVVSYDGSTTDVSGKNISIHAAMTGAGSKGSANAVYAGKTGVTTLQGADGGSSITLTAEGHTAVGVMGTQSGKAIINGGSGDDTVTINAVSSGQTAWGLITDGKGSILIDGKAGNNSLSINAENTTANTAQGMGAYVGSMGWSGTTQQTVQHMDTVNVQAKSAGGEATALFAAASSGITVKDANTALNFTAGASTTGSGAANSLWADAGTNTITGSDGADSFTFSAQTQNGAATGLKATLHQGNTGYSGGVNTITGGAGNDTLTLTATATGSGTATGMQAVGTSSAGNASRNTITGVEDVTVTAKSTSGSASGLNATSGGKNEILGADTVNINATSTSGSATGLSASGSGKNEILNANNVEVTVKGIEGSSGLSASYSTNLIEAKNVTVNVDQTATGGSSNTATITGMNSASNYLNPNYKNEIKAQDIEIKVNSQNYNYAAVGINSAGGKNIITGTGAAGDTDKLLLEVTGNSSTSMSPSIGMKASDKGGVNTIQGVEDVAIDVKDKSNGGAVGLYASATGKNEILAAASVIIKAEAEVGHTRGIYSLGTGSSNVIAGTDKDTDTLDITATLHGAGSVWGVNAEGGTNTLRDFETVTITTKSDYTGTNFVSSGLYALAGGKNEILDSKNVNISVDANNIAYGVLASNSTNTISNAENINISATSAKTTATGISAAGGATNSIIGGAGNADRLNLTVTGATSATGLSASDNASRNTISDIENVTITAKSTSGPVYGVFATTGGKNEILGSGKVDITASGAGLTYGAFASATGSNIITGDSVTLSSNSTGNTARGISANSTGSSNTITAGDVTVNATTTKVGNYAAQAMVAESGGKNTITSSGNVELNATANEGNSYGLSATNAGSSNVIDATGNVDVTVQGKASAYGLFATIGATNTITAGGDVNIDSSGIGMFATSGGKTNVSAGGDVSVSGSGLGMYATGVNTLNTISGVGGNVSITGGAAAMQVENSGQNIIEKVAGDVTVSSTKARGLYTTSGGQNIIRDVAGDITIQSTVTSGMAHAMTATGAGSQNILGSTGGAVNITANSTASDAYAVDASDGGKNIITGESITVTATGAGGSAGIITTGLSSASNTLTANEISVTSQGGGSSTYGVRADGGGTNTLNANKVTIDASGTGNAYALHANNPNSTNIIQAAHGSEGIEVRITVAGGQGKEAFAMYAAGTNARNQIIGTEQSDFISIKGDIKAQSGGKNIISTGAGEDHVVLDGTVTLGGLTLEMGDGYDVLSLKAKDFTEFKGRYETWLNELKATGYATHSIEAIEVLYNETWSAQDKIDLHNFFDSLNFGGTVLYPVDMSVGTETHADMANIYHEGNYDGSTGSGNSDHTFASTRDDHVDVRGDVSHTDLTFAGGGHDTLTVAGNLIDAHVTTESTYTGTLHVEAGSLEHTDLNLAGGTNAVTLHGSVDSLSSLVLGGGNDTLSIEGNFTGQATMGAGNDYVVLHGSAHGGMVDGGAGNDTLIGDAGNNILVGGAGYDVLTGGTGADTFVWKAGDAGTAGAPATDVVTDFNIDEGDKLDLSGLLGDGAKDNLDNFLNVTHENGNTVLNISTNGESAAGHFDQVIVLENSTITAEQLMQQLLLSQ